MTEPTLPATRNPVLLQDGRIDCELEHPIYGWVPFTAAANDSAGHGRLIHAKLKQELKS